MMGTNDGTNDASNDASNETLDQLIIIRGVRKNDEGKDPLSLIEYSFRFSHINFLIAFTFMKYSNVTVMAATVKQGIGIFLFTRHTS